MTQCSIIVKDALIMTGVSSVISPAEPEQQSNAFRVLQGMLQEFTEDNLNLYLTTVYEIDDDLGESGGLTESIKALLAERICVYQQINIAPDLATLIKRARDRIYGFADDPDVVWPDNLPLGAGNWAPNRRTFWPGKKC